MTRSAADDRSRYVVTTPNGRGQPETSTEIVVPVPNWPGSNGPAPTLRPEAFHGDAGNIVRLLEPCSEADPIAVLLTFLVGFGNLCGPNPHIPLGTARQHARLFVAIVGDTAEGRKGQSWNDARFALRMIDESAFDAAYVSGLSSGEGLVKCVQGGTPDFPKRAIVYEPEYARLLAATSRDGATLSPIIREAWDGGRLAVMTRRDPLVADHAFVSIVGHVTSAELVRVMPESYSRNGFANRFLFASAQRSKFLSRPPAPHMYQLDAVVARLKESLGTARVRYAFEFDEAARVLWDDMYPILEAKSADAIGDLCARGSQQTLRLALVYSMLDGAEAIAVPHLRAAHAVWDYCAGSVASVFGNTCADPVADKLLTALQLAWPSPMTFSQQHAVFGNSGLGSRISEARAALEARGFIRTVRVPAKTKPLMLSIAVATNYNPPIDISDN